MRASVSRFGSGCLAVWAFSSAGISAISSILLSVRRKKHFLFSSFSSRSFLINVH
jgi:hypothetical protein